MPPLARFAPGLAKLLEYKLADAPADIKAGLAVTAVAVPVGIAYAGLAGFRPEVGLYSSLLPLVVYAIFGSSRQLIVGPDAATCAVIAAAVTPLAAGDEVAYASLSAMRLAHGIDMYRRKLSSPRRARRLLVEAYLGGLSKWSGSVDNPGASRQDLRLCGS